MSFDWDNATVMDDGQWWCRPVVILAERDKLVMDAELGSILRECKIKVITREGPLSAHFCSSPNHNLCPVNPLLTPCTESISFLAAG